MEVFNYALGEKVNYGVIQIILLYIVSYIPRILIFTAFIFLLGFLSVNSPLTMVLGWVVLEIGSIMGIAPIKYAVVKYSCFNTWDFSRFIFENVDNTLNINLMSSTVVSLIYFMFFILIGIKVFNKREIKNI